MSADRPSREAQSDTESSQPVADTAAATEPVAETHGTALRGAVIEGYELIRELHRGGQGVVYEAFQQSMKRKVAIKVLLAGPFAPPSARKRFSREVELVWCP